METRKTIGLACAVVIMLFVALWLGGLSSVGAVVLSEGFSADVFAAGSWSRSDESVYVTLVDGAADGAVHIGADGDYDDGAFASGSLALPVTIEARMRLVSGGRNYLLPDIHAFFENSEGNASGNININYLSQGSNQWGWASGNDWGWSFGNPSEGNTRNANSLRAPSAENQWVIVRAVIRPNGGELQVKRDRDPDFQTVATRTWSITGPINSIRFRQPWDAVSDLDYVSAIDAATGALSFSQITTNSARDVHPKWSPDGTKIVFRSERSGNNDIWVVDADGQNPAQLTSDPAEDGWPEWSPDGRKIAFRSARASAMDIWVMDADGSNPTRLTTDPAQDGHPDWSPDGSKIIFGSGRTGDSQIWSMDFDGNNQTQLTFGPGGNAHPNFSPDGRKIQFQSNRSGNQDIWVMDADGSNPVQLTFGGAYEEHFAWSPDSRRAVYDSDIAGSPDLWLMDADGGNKTRLTDNPASETNPDWSPDGAKIVFNSNREGNQDIWVMTLPGQPGNGPPVASLNQASGFEGMAVALDGSASTDPDGDTLLYRWDFDNDGTWDTPFSAEPVTSHAWADDHQGLVGLEVSAGNITDTATASITIANAPPTADAGSDHRVMWGDEVRFRGSFTDPGVYDLPTGFWDFGDGNSAAGLEVTHVFANPGSYAAVLAVVDKDGGIGTDTAEVMVDKRPSKLVYLGGWAADYSDTAVLEAVLADDRGAPIVGGEVRFAFGDQAVTGITDIAGRALVSLDVNQPAGEKSLTAAFEGDDRYLASATTNTFTVSKEVTALTYTGDVITQRNQTAGLKAQLAEADSPAGDLSGKEVIFYITDGVNSQQSSAVTDADGVVQTNVPITIPGSLYRITASFPGDGFYLGSASQATPYVVWEAIAGLKISGGGWLLKSGQKANFGFTAKYVSNSPVPIGQLEFQDRASNQNIHSEGFDWLVLTADNYALLEGLAKINGVGGHTFRLIVSDSATPGAGRDTLELKIDGLTIASGTLGGGNIVVR